MKKLPAIIVPFFLVLVTYSQEPSPRPFQFKNSIQVDLGGHGFYYSLNYERVILNGSRFKTASQAGIAYYPPNTGMRDIWIPIGINEIITFGAHHIEAGLGYMPIIEALRYPDDTPDEWFGSHLMTARIGYRFQKPGSRLILRAAFTPVLEVEYLGHGDGFHPLGGISVGYGF